MNINFPEEIFTANARNQPLWEAACNFNLAKCGMMNIMFCGIARNCGDKLERNILRIHKTGSAFKDYKIFIYENNSTDNTKDILKQYQDNKLDYISEDINDADFENNSMCDHYDRCLKMSKARNKYMELFVEPNYNEFPITCIIDLDLIGGWSYEGFYDATTFLFSSSKANNIAGLTAYGVITGIYDWEEIKLEDVKQSDYKMYDSFAFRTLDWGDNPLTTPQQMQLNYVTRPSGVLKVLSNFGGLGIYKSKYIHNIRYSSKKYDHGIADCDQVCFHKDILAQTSKYIAMYNRLIVSYSPHRYV